MPKAQNPFFKKKGEIDIHINADTSFVLYIFLVPVEMLGF